MKYLKANILKKEFNVKKNLKYKKNKHLNIVYLTERKQKKILFP